MSNQTTAAPSVAGDLDETFNGGGVLRFRFYERERNVAFDAAVGGDERIYIAGSVIGRYAIAVLNKDGSFAKDFNRGGMLLSSFHNTERSRGYRIAVDEEKVRVLGTTEVMKFGTTRYCPAIASYHLNGELDTTYGDGGYQVIDPDFEDGRPDFLPEQWPPTWSVFNQKTYVAALRRILGIPISMVVTCLDANGQIDRQFGSAGHVIIEHPQQVTALYFIRATEEGIYLGGAVSSAELRAFCKISLSGEFDTTFGQDGFVTYETPYSRVNALPAQKSPMLLGVGRSTRMEEGETLVRYQGALVSLDPNGHPDKQFNNGEPVFTEIEFATVWSFGAVQNDGRIVVSGGTFDYSAAQQRPDTLERADYNTGEGPATLESSHEVVCRYLSNGALDTSFGREGKGWITFNINQHATTRGIAVQADNGILLVGETGDGSAFVVRFKG